MRRLSLAIDAAMRASGLQSAPQPPPPPQQQGVEQEGLPQRRQAHGAYGKKQTVHALQLVRARPFYGYHPTDKLFIKIVL